MTAAQLMKMREAAATATDGRNAKALGRLITSGHRMSRMIEQLLDFTRLRVGGGIDVEPKTRRHRHAGASRWWTSSKPATRTAPSASRPRARRHGTWDADRLSQVLSNLVANACQHGDPAAGVRVAHRRRRARRRPRAGAQHGRDTRRPDPAGLRSADRRPAAAGSIAGPRARPVHQQADRGGARRRHRGLVERGGGNDVHGVAAAFRRWRRGAGRPHGARARRSRRRGERRRAAAPADQSGRPRARAAARERGAVPPAGRGGEGLRDLHARSERPRRHLERRRRSGSRATTRGRSSASTSREFYEDRRRCAPASASASWRARRATDGSRTRAGACARTARDSGPTW